MTENSLPAPEGPTAQTPPAPHPFNVLAYEPLMTRIKAAQLKPLFTGFLVALGVMAIANVVMFALVQQAQQETVDFATKIATNAETGGVVQLDDVAAAEHMASFAPLADLIDSIKAKEARRDALLAQRPEFAGDLPVANAPDWRALAAQQLRAYDDQVDAQIAMLSKRAAVASASLAPSSLDRPAAFALPLPAPSSAAAKPAPVNQAPAKQSAAKAKRAPAQSPAQAKADSSYSRELTAALNRASRAETPAPAATPADTAPAVQPTAAPAAEAAPIATAAPAAPPAVTAVSDQVGQ